MLLQKTAPLLGIQYYMLSQIVPLLAKGYSRFTVCANKPAHPTLSIVETALDDKKLFHLPCAINASTSSIPAMRRAALAGVLNKYFVSTSD